MKCPHPLTFVPDCYITQKMCGKTVNTHFFAIQFVPECYQTQEMCARVVSEDLFLIVYCPDIFKTQRMCDEAVDDCLSALKFIPNWFVTRKMLEKFDNALKAHDDILFYNEDFHKVTFIANQRHIPAVDLDKINFDNDNNFDEDYPNTIIIHATLLARRSEFKKCKALKKL